MLDLPPHQPGCQWHPEGLGVELQLKHDVFLAWCLEKRGWSRGRSKPYDPWGLMVQKSGKLTSWYGKFQIPRYVQGFIHPNPRWLAGFPSSTLWLKILSPIPNSQNSPGKNIQDEWVGNTWHVFIILLGVEICGNQWEIIWVYGTYQTSLKIKDTDPLELTCPLTRLLLGSSLLSEVMFNIVQWPFHGKKRATNSFELVQSHQNIPLILQSKHGGD